MPALDLAIPTALFIIVTVALFLNSRTEKKLKSTVEEREFRTRDVILLVVMMAVVISVIAVTSVFNPSGLISNIFTVFFLFAYSILLFTFAYLFSNGSKRKAQLTSIGFGIASFIAAIVSLLGPVTDGLTIYRFSAFFVLAVLSFCTLIVDQKRPTTKERWYVAIQPAVLFLLLFVFFNVFYTGSIRLWFPYLLDVFALTFAALIILYLSSLFTWKTVVLFAGLLTVLDIILVFSGPMMTAATTFTGAGLPVLVWLPKIPIVYGTDSHGNTGLLLGGLGLGDFFFAGLLAIQTSKKFNIKTAFISVVAMTVALGVWLAYMEEIRAVLAPFIGTITGFPATLCIITGWLPIAVVALAWQRHKQKKNSPSTPAPQPTETATSP